MPSRRPKNQVVIEGDITYIIIYNQDGSESCRTLVDTDLYEKKLRYGKWSDHKNKDGSPRAVVGTYGRLSHVVIELATGKPVPDGMEVDHINRNILDNRACNLRVVTHAQNNLNRRFSKHASGEQYIHGSGPYTIKLCVTCIESIESAKLLRDAMIAVRDSMTPGRRYRKATNHSSGEPYIQGSGPYEVTIRIRSIESLDTARLLRDALIDARNSIMIELGLATEYYPQE